MLREYVSQAELSRLGTGMIEHLTLTVNIESMGRKKASSAV